jgi:hypothetical protein
MPRLFVHGMDPKTTAANTPANPGASAELRQVASNGCRLFAKLTHAQGVPLPAKPQSASAMSRERVRS